MKEGVKVAVEVANKCSVKKAVAGTEKKAEETRGRKQRNIVSSLENIKLWECGVLCVCACVCTCTCEELFCDVRRCQKCGLHSVLFL